MNEQRRAGETSGSTWIPLTNVFAPRRSTPRQGAACWRLDATEPEKRGVRARLVFRSAELLTFGGRATDAVWMAGHYGFIACMIGFSAIGGVLMVPRWNVRPSRGGGR